MTTSLPSSRSRSPAETDIAAAMGFASFGAKPNPPKKKRKIAGTNTEQEGSGSNNTPLGVRPRGVDVEVEVEQQGIEEMGRGVMGEGEEWGQEGYGDGGAGADVLKRNNREVQKGDTSLPNRQVDNPNLPSSTIPTSSTHQPPPSIPRIPTPPTLKPQNEKQLLEEARQRGLQRLSQLTQQKQQPQSSGGRKADGDWNWNALRKGVRDEKGDMAFYDSSFVEDPWRGL